MYLPFSWCESKPRDWKLFLRPCLDTKLRPRWGGSAGVSFSAMRKRRKNRLGRSPLRTSLGYQDESASRLGSARHPCCGSCFCHHTRPPWAAGPIARWFPRPGLLWRSGVATAGSLALGSWEQLHTKVRPWQETYHHTEEQAYAIECLAIYVTLPEPGPTGEPHPAPVTASRGSTGAGPLVGLW